MLIVKPSESIVLVSGLDSKNLRVNHWSPAFAVARDIIRFALPGLKHPHSAELAMIARSSRPNSRRKQTCARNSSRSRSNGSHNEELCQW